MRARAIDGIEQHAGAYDRGVAARPPRREVAESGGRCLVVLTALPRALSFAPQTRALRSGRRFRKLHAQRFERPFAAQAGLSRERAHRRTRWQSLPTFDRSGALSFAEQMRGCAAAR